MAPEDLKRILSRQPFLPTRLHVSGGIKHDLRYPDAAMVFRGMVIIGMNRNIPGDYFDEPIFVDLSHVVQAEPIIENQPA